MELNQRVASLQKDFNQPEDTSNWRNSVVAKVRLLDGGQRGLGRNMARLGADAARLGRAAADNELVHQVTRGFYGALQAQGRAVGPGRCARATREQLGDGAVPRARLEIEDVTRRWIEPGPTPLPADASPGPRGDIRLLIEGVARLPHVRTLASRPAADSGGWVV